MQIKPGKIAVCFLLALLVSALGCNQKNKTLPSGHQQIPREQMIRLMADLELTESALKLKQLKMSRDSVKQFANYCYDSLYAYYKATPEQFRANLKFYQGDPEDFRSMMDSVIVTISRHRDSIANPPKPAMKSVSPVKK